MRINKIILVSILLLILTLGAVSASDNTDSSDSIASSQDIDIIADDDDDWGDDDDDGGDDYVEYEEGSGTVRPNINVKWPNEIKAGDEIEISYDLPEDMNTNVVLFINNERVDDGQEADNSTPYGVFIDEFGKNVLKFKFFGDDKYAPFTTQKTYTVSDYKFNLELTDENPVYGQNVNVTIDLPFDATGYVTVAGVKYEIGDEEAYLSVPLKNLQIGTNQVQIKYLGDEKYPAKTKNLPVNVKAKVVCSPSMAFNDVVFYLKLPANAQGNLEVCVDGANTKTSRVVNGIAEVRFDGLSLGSHIYKAKYTGNDYSCDEAEQQFEIAPAILIDSFKTTQDDNIVKISLPVGENGKLEVKYLRYDGEGGLQIGEVTKSADVFGEFLFDLSTLYYGYYVYEVRYTSDDGYFFYMIEEGYIRDPFSMEIIAPETVLSDEDVIEININHLGTDSGIIELYVDGEYYDEIECDESGMSTFYIEDALDVGTHEITAVFTGSEHYAPFEESTTILSTLLMFLIPDEIMIGSDDEITIETVNDATGVLVVYVDGEEFARQSIDGGTATISLESLAFDTHSIRVAYENGNYPTSSVSTVSNVSYTFKMSDESSEYASDDLFGINVPKDIAIEDLVVKVDNITCPVVQKDGGIGIDTSDLDIGSHVITVSYPGDDTFYPLSIEKTIDVAGKISVPSNVTAGDEKAMSLTLPKNPQGKLQLYEFDENYKSYVLVKSLGFTPSGNNAVAEIPMSELGFGDHKIKVTYSGDDYEIADLFKEISIKLDMNFEREIQYGKNSVITLNLPNAQGSIDVFLDGDEYDVVDFNDGHAKITFRGLEVGQHTFELLYEGVYAFDVEELFIVHPQITVPTGVVIDGAKSITLNSGSEPVGTVTVYADGKKYKELDLDEGKQSISLGGLSNGVHQLSIVYDSWDEMKYVKNYTVTTKKASMTAKDMSMNYLDGSKFKVLVKDYKGKKVKKGQSVKFYVDGKLFATAKTDSKGYASVALTHAPGKHTVKAVYKATTLTKKVTVKQILTLKKVTVKKSAKKLDLTVTIKKVKGLSVKNQKVTFKFNGKTYKAVTNAKGVAKVTIPQNVLKKLKVGKSITYQATFIKATVKQTVKVSK